MLVKLCLETLAVAAGFGECLIKSRDGVIAVFLVGHAVAASIFDKGGHFFFELAVQHLVRTTMAVARSLCTHGGRISVIVARTTGTLHRRIGDEVVARLPWATPLTTKSIGFGFWYQ